MRGGGAVMLARPRSCQSSTGFLGSNKALSMSVRGEGKVEVGYPHSTGQQPVGDCAIGFCLCCQPNGAVNALEEDCEMLSHCHQPMSAVNTEEQKEMWEIEHEKVLLERRDLLASHSPTHPAEEAKKRCKNILGIRLFCTARELEKSWVMAYDTIYTAAVQRPAVLGEGQQEIAGQQLGPLSPRLAARTITNRLLGYSQGFCLPDFLLHLTNMQFTSDDVMNNATGGPASGIMVWGAIAYNDRTPLVFAEGTMNSECYIQNIIQPILSQFLQCQGDVLILQQQCQCTHVYRHLYEQIKKSATQTWVDSYFARAPHSKLQPTLVNAATATAGERENKDPDTPSPSATGSDLPPTVQKRSVKARAYPDLFFVFETKKHGSDMGDIATHIKCPIAVKCKVLNWRAVFSSDCVYLWDVQR
ncbi:hypothetical protein PR048_011217 [Dryococelus australis]|uniref:Transposase n=1 Tax=Dryococelus australis TaxID=614101 RepID=A0ABQ9HLP9_9NEOP|nr:hypothetical protein PR048_011217 [Dryococelus australis]